MRVSRRGAGRAAASSRVLRAVRVIIRTRNTELTDGSAFAEPDLVEDDYYRLVKQPRD